jgi:hypothetical protein
MNPPPDIPTASETEVPVQQSAEVVLDREIHEIFAAIGADCRIKTKEYLDEVVVMGGGE